jgi:hypothetical protein
MDGPVVANAEPVPVGLCALLALLGAPQASRSGSV